MFDGGVPFRILITDDDPDLLFTLGRQLEADGFEVHPAASGEAALAVAARALPHSAVLDLLMPGMDGFELARRLKRLGDVPIIMLTALDDEDTVVRGLEEFADDYVTKPFSYRQLLARVRRVLERAWPGGEGSTQALWEYVRRLRQKLGDDPAHARYVESERGIGYRLK